MLDSSTNCIQTSTDWGVLYGYGLFETFRTYNGVPLQLEEHLDRLLKSARYLQFVRSPSKEDLRCAVSEFIERYGLKSRVVRLSLSYGNPDEGVAPSFSLSDRPVPYGPVDYLNGIGVAISASRRNERSPIVRHKTFNQLDNLLAWREGRRRGAKESLLLNTSGFLAEGSRSNIFFIRQDEIFTPSEDCGLLPGIARATVMTLLKEAGIEVHEGRFSVDEFRLSCEAFATNSVMGVMPVVAVDDLTVGSGAPGELTRRAAALYENYVKNQVEQSLAQQVRID